MAKTIDKEIFNKNSEKFDFSIDKKIVKAVTGLAVLSLAAYGVYDLATDEKSTAPTPTEKTETVATSTGSEIEVPNEAKDFVEKYGNRYSDPVAVYYADKAYQKENGKSAILDDSFVNSYVPYDVSHYEIPKESKTGLKFIELNQSGAIDLNDINSQVLSQASIYLNLIAKNPSSKSANVIDKEFYVYNESQNKTIRNSYIAKLLSEIKNRHSAAANYEIVKISNNAHNKENNNESYTSWEVHKGDVNGSTFYSLRIDRLAIKVTEYDTKGEETISYDTVYDEWMDISVGKDNQLSFGVMQSDHKIYPEK